MGDSSDFRLLLDESLDINEDRLSESTRGDVVIGDRDLSIFQRPNRVALGQGTVANHGRLPGQDALICYDIPLQCVLHPAAGCHFVSARLVVDLKPTAGALVRDMTPREIKGDSPVEVTTTVTARLTFDIVPDIVGAEAGRERSTTRKLHYPVIIASGKGFTKAVWDFRSVPGEYLYADREMRLLVSAPDGAELSAQFNLLAKVARDGVAAAVPMFRKRGEVGRTYRLV